MSSPNETEELTELWRPRIRPSEFAPEVLIRVWDGVVRLRYTKRFLVKRQGER